jgi:hypothetical protein
MGNGTRMLHNSGCDSSKLAMFTSPKLKDGVSKEARKTNNILTVAIEFFSSRRGY